MDKAEFLKQEYLALRREARATRGRIFALSLSALFLLPALLAAASRLDILVLTLLAPAAALAAALLHLSEWLALSRCGRYVKVYVEHGIEGVVGWEHWLGTGDAAEPRTADRIAAYAVQGLLLAQYAAASALAAEGAFRLLALPAAAACAAPILLLGAGHLSLLARYLRRSTATGTEDTCLKALLVRPHCIHGPERD